MFFDCTATHFQTSTAYRRKTGRKRFFERNQIVEYLRNCCVEQDNINTFNVSIKINEVHE